MSVARIVEISNQFNNDVEDVAILVGLSDPALRILISLFVAFLLGWIQRDVLHRSSPNAKNFYTTICGLAITWFNFGTETAHTFITVFANYILLQLMGGTLNSVILSWIFNMGYLLVGYLYSTVDYPVDWTVPHCGLTMRMIGLAYNLYDGHRSQDKVTPEQKKLSITSAPTLLEIYGFSYFIGSCLVGPLFPYRHYLGYINGVTDNEEGKKPSNVLAGLARFGAGLVYCGLFALLGPYWPNEFLLTAEFNQSPFFLRCFHLIMWGKCFLLKYLGIWLMAEATCIISGLAYNGKDERGNSKWDACRNFKIVLFETTCSFKGLISSFNVNTNLWVSRYVFKRLRFLGNRDLSQIASLVFLAVWHGFWSGYFMNFFLEFLYVQFEVELTELIKKLDLESTLHKPMVKALWYIPVKLFLLLFMGYPLTGFALLHWDKMMQVYWSMYFCGHTIFIAFLILNALVFKPLVKSKEKKKDD